MDVLFPVFEWLATPTGQVSFVLVVLAWGGIGLYQSLQRRQGFRQFAAHYGLRFEGLVVPDGRAPYIQFDHLKWSVTIYNAVEGPWEGFEVAAFDYNVGRHTRRTAAIVRTPHVLGEGVHPATAPFDEVLTSNDLLYVRSPKLLPPSALPGFLSAAVALARPLSDAAGQARAAGVPMFRSLD